MGDFINTIDLLGDEAVIDSLIEHTITEYKDDVITTLGQMAFVGCRDLKTIELPKVSSMGANAFYQACSDAIVSFPSLVNVPQHGLSYGYFKVVRLPKAETIPRFGLYYLGSLIVLTLDNPNKVCALEATNSIYATQIDGNSSAEAQKNQGYVYVPNALVDTYKNATNWTTLAHKIRVIEDYTISGTLKGIIILGDETEIVDHEATTVASGRCMNNTVLTSVDLPNVEVIHSSAFKGCTALETISFPNATKIGGDAFRECTSLKEVSFPQVTNLNEYTGTPSMGTFRNCTKLESIDLPNLVDIISSGAFRDNPALKKVNVPNWETFTYGDYMFYNDSALETLRLPKLGIVGGSWFNNCTKLTAVILPKATMVTLRGTTFANTPIANGTGYIYVPRALVEDYKVATNWAQYAGQFRALEDYTISGTRLGGLYFGDETEIVDEETTGVAVSKFNGNIALTSVDLPKVTSVGASAFQGCTSLKDVNMPLLNSIGANAFVNCTSLEAIDFPLATHIGTSAGGPFTGCTSLKNVNLPLATQIHKSSFRGCTSLEELSLPSATRLFNQVFQDCSSLKKLNLPEVTQIDNIAFEDCAIATVDLPKVTSLGTGIFDNCLNLNTLVLRSTTLVTLLASTSGSFMNTPIEKGTGYIYVPRALVEEYKVATNWTVFTNQFRALEDYTVDGTITGALDESKI